jgi:hypothetical protein
MIEGKKCWVGLLAVIFLFGVPFTSFASVTFTPTDDPAVQNVAYASNTATFPNVNVGTASADRVVVVGVGNDNGTSNGGISSVTIGGGVCNPRNYLQSGQ